MAVSFADLCVSTDGEKLHVCGVFGGNKQRGWCLGRPGDFA